MNLEPLRELERVAQEMRERRVNHGKSVSPTLIAWADRITALIAALGEGQEAGAVAWLKELDGGAVKCVPRDFHGAFPVYRESTPLRCKDGQPGDRNRPAQEPGGVECMKCGCIFIGEEWHSVCAVCLDKPGSERLCDFFADVGEVARFMDELCNVVTELTGDEGEDDPITVLRRHIASSTAHTSEARDAARLDWLARAGDVTLGIVVDAPHDGDYYVSHDLAGGTGYGATLGEAIDAAMCQEAE